MRDDDADPRSNGSIAGPKASPGLSAHPDNAPVAAQGSGPSLFRSSNVHCALDTFSRSLDALNLAACDPDGCAGGLSLQIRPVDISKPGTKNPDLSVSACGPRDLSCEIPLVSSGTNLDGWASLELPNPTFDLWFVGHLKVTDSDSKRELNALLYTFPPPRESPAFRSIWILPKWLADDNAKNFPLVLDWENKGGIAFSVVSCNRVPAGGVVVSSSTKERAYYLPKVAFRTHRRPRPFRVDSGFWPVWSQAIRR